MKLKILRRSNTEQKIRRATNDDMSKNPVVTDLVELSLLTYKSKTLKVITGVLLERLSHVKCAQSNTRYTGPVASGSSPETKLRRRLLLKDKMKSYSSKKAAPSDRQMPGLCAHLPHLVSINKSLLVVLYLMETGSSHFTNWAKQVHFGWGLSIKSLEKLLRREDDNFSKPTAVENYQQIVAKKLIHVEHLCTNETLLAEYRLNQHKLRSDMARPGVKSIRVRSAMFSNELELESEVIEVEMDFGKLHHANDTGNDTKYGSSFTGATSRARASMESTRLEVVLELDEELFLDESEHSDRLSTPVSHVCAY